MIMNVLGLGLFCLSNVVNIDGSKIMAYGS